MDKVKCELCPLSSSCRAYKEAVEDDKGSYHPQEVVRAYSWECPLFYLVKELTDKGFPKE